MIFQDIYSFAQKSPHPYTKDSYLVQTISSIVTFLMLFKYFFKVIVIIVYFYVIFSIFLLFFHKNPLQSKGTFDRILMHSSVFYCFGV